MDPKDLNIGEDFEGDSEFASWAEAPGGRFYRVEGAVPTPSAGSMFRPDLGDADR